jgi:hypothetical protein
MPILQRHDAATLAAAFSYTLVLWLWNFCIIAPPPGWGRSPERT